MSVKANLQYYKLDHQCPREDVSSPIGSFGVLRSQVMALFLAFYFTDMMMALIGVMQCFCDEFASVWDSEYSIRHWRNLFQFSRQSTRPWSLISVLWRLRGQERLELMCMERVGERGERGGDPFWRSSRLCKVSCRNRHTTLPSCESANTHTRTRFSLYYIL